MPDKPDKPDKNDKADRRGFLKHSGATLGGFMLNPVAGLIGLAATLGGTAQAESEAEAVKNRVKRPLIRSAAPIDILGRPFGGRVSSLSALQVAQALQKEDQAGRYVLVCGHETGMVSLSTLEVMRTERGWSHAVASHHNRTYGPTTQTPVDGARLQKTGPQAGQLFRHQELLSGIGSIRCELTTPWNTVLCGESGVGPDYGWVIEVNPFTGSVIKRFSLGRLSPIGLAAVAQVGQPFVVYILGTHLFKFVSHQRFDAKHLDANATLLTIGELYVADLAKSAWQRVISEELSNADWIARLRGPVDAQELPQAILNPYALRQVDGALVILQDSEVTTVREDGSAHVPGALTVTTELGSPEKYVKLSQVNASTASFTVEHEGDSSIILSV